MDYAIGYEYKPLGGRAGFTMVFHRTEERLVVYRHAGDRKGHKRIVWRSENNEPYVKFNGKLHHIELRPSYTHGCRVWALDSDKSPIDIEMTWQK